MKNWFVAAPSLGTAIKIIAVVFGVTAIVILAGG